MARVVNVRDGHRVRGPAARVEAGRHRLQRQRLDAVAEGVEVLQRPLERVLLKIVLRVEAAAGQLPPKPQQPRRARRVRPKLDARVRPEAERPVGCKAHVGGRRRPRFAVPRQQRWHAERDVLQEGVAVEEDGRRVAARKGLGHRRELAVARQPLAEQLVAARRRALVQIQQVVAVRARVRAVELERELWVLDLRRAQVRRPARAGRDGRRRWGACRCRWQCGRYGGWAPRGWSPTCGA